MKQIYLIIGLGENKVLTDVSLGTSGITEYDKHFVIGELIDKRADLKTALEIAEANVEKFELGVEVKPIYITDFKTKENE